MDKSVKIWLVIWTLFWISLVFAYLADTLGIFETSNLGFMETIWISWIGLTVGLGLILTIIIRFTKKM